MKLRIATRRSALALAQTRMVARELQARAPGLEIEEIHLVTEGDRVQDRPLAAIGGKGLFIKELESALLEGRADLAVHSMKDLPADLATGLALVAIPPRESPYDLLVTSEGHALEDLPKGARVGTSSLRREVQLRALRPDLRVEMLRGNVDTRLRKLREGQYDAIVLAEAGLRRLGLQVRARSLEGVLVPAVGQGALALEARAGDALVAEVAALWNDPESALAARVERTVMRALGGSCSVPMGALARRCGDRLEAWGFYADQDRRVARAHVEGGVEQPEQLGERLAAELLAQLA